MPNRIQNRRDTTANWVSVNPVLADGEHGIEKTVSGLLRLKTGDGVTAWNSLAYSSYDPSATQYLSELNFSTDIASGVANKDLTLPAGYFVYYIEIVNGNATSLTNIQCVTDPTGDNNPILYDKTIAANKTWIFTLLGDQIVYSSSKVLRFNATGNTISMSIIVGLKNSQV